MQGSGFPQFLQYYFTVRDARHTHPNMQSTGIRNTLPNVRNVFVKKSGFLKPLCQDFAQDKCLSEGGWVA